jgi:hypothetical protein
MSAGLAAKANVHYRLMATWGGDAVREGALKGGDPFGLHHLLSWDRSLTHQLVRLACLLGRTRGCRACLSCCCCCCCCHLLLLRILALTQPVCWGHTHPPPPTSHLTRCHAAGWRSTRSPSPEKCAYGCPPPLQGPCVLFATPGMLHGGTSLEVFKAWAGGEANLVILPGYCATGTVGNKLMSGVTKGLRLDGGQTLDVRCKVRPPTRQGWAQLGS